MRDLPEAKEVGGGSGGDGDLPDEEAAPGEVAPVEWAPGDVAPDGETASTSMPEEARPDGSGGGGGGGQIATSSAII